MPEPTVADQLNATLAHVGEALQAVGARLAAIAAAQDRTAEAVRDFAAALTTLVQAQGRTDRTLALMAQTIERWAGNVTLAGDNQGRLIKLTRRLAREVRRALEKLDRGF